MRLISRVAELVNLAQPAACRPVLQSGALSPGPGEGMAWTEMSRCLLVHWVRLAAGRGMPVVQDCRVLAPTKWGFHPQGGLARALVAPGLAPDTARAAVAAMDACVPVDLALDLALAGALANSEGQRHA